MPSMHGWSWYTVRVRWVPYAIVAIIVVCMQILEVHIIVSVGIDDGEEKLQKH